MWKLLIRLVTAVEAIAVESETKNRIEQEWALRFDKYSEQMNGAMRSHVNECAAWHRHVVDSVTKAIQFSADEPTVPTSKKVH